VSAPRRATLADVAARSGVSLKTASRALNGEYGVAAATAAKVQEAARALGFRPNHLARSLASSRTSSAVGLVISSVSDPFIAAVAGAVETVLAPRDLQFVSASHGDDADRQRALVQALVERRIDALIMIPAPGDASYLNREVAHGLVVVSLDRPLEGTSVDTVTIDNEAGARATVGDLVAAGHRRIAALSNDGRLWTMQRRHAGYLRALDDAGIDPDPSLMALDCHDIRAAEAAVTSMLRLPEPPTAVFSGQNLAGRGALRAMLATGRRVELVVFDELDPDLLVIQPQVVVESDPVRLGTVAAQMTLERLDGLAGAARDVVLPPLFRHPGRPPAEVTGMADR
jgi:LacI family transcriptional regulator